MADSVSVAAGGNDESNAITPPSGAIFGLIMFKADNDGTPASGDIMRVFYRVTTGDPDADPDSADEYTTSDTDQHLGSLDTNTNDPSIGQAVLPGEEAKGIKIYVENDSGGRAITVSAQIRWQYKDDNSPTETQVDW